MKTGILALLVVLAISQSEALKCHCGGTYKYCQDPVEICTGLNQVCASVLLTVGSRPSYFQSCMSQFNCAKLNQPGISTARCCTFDLCNR
ncbi:unnamed protein product [Tetraodon nigroviridis]|uniref:(spotted green pufferfish) hypothetical protein n=1 Tax=Tetraodon nigroviridis TaxID=99883 RepID=Q4T713_TETNG|nr:unnamed protein product [Tetraodon nigroviridis]